MPTPRKFRAGALITDGETEYITAATLVRRWGGAVTLGTLKNWRSQGRGPPFTKLERLIIYPLEKLIEWEKTNTFRKVKS